MASSQSIVPVNKVTLYRFETKTTQFCFSPYVNKLDALLTFSGIGSLKYEGGSVHQAPHGKLPYIDLDGTFIPDSELAYNFCISKGLVGCLDKKAGLNEKEAAISRSIQAFVERELLEMLMYERWIENWYLTRDKHLTEIKALIRPIVAYLFVYRPYKALMWGTGIARFSPEERQRNLEAALSAFITLIPTSGYIMDKATPTRVDATVFGYLESLFSNPELSPKMTAEMHKYPHILEYRNRLVAEFWPQRKKID